VKIKFEILVLLSPRGFDERFHHYCKTSKTYFEAYEKTEIEFESSFGKRKYSNYDSFRVTMNKRMKK
tara:strand:+ start:590 stop:790 length:201 start_codon:yes stop_codon:yes gene_type:complete